MSDVNTKPRTYADEVKELLDRKGFSADERAKFINALAEVYITIVLKESDDDTDKAIKNRLWLALS